MNRNEATALQDRIAAIQTELETIRSAFRPGPVWNALGTAYQAVHGAGQELHDLVTGSVTGSPLV